MSYDSRTLDFKVRKPKWMVKQEEFLQDNKYPKCLGKRPYVDCPSEDDVFNDDTTAKGICCMCPIYLKKRR